MAIEQDLEQASLRDVVMDVSEYDSGLFSDEFMVDHDVGVL